MTWLLYLILIPAGLLLGALIAATAAEAIEAEKVFKAFAGTADSGRVVVLMPASTREEGRNRVLAERTSLAQQFAERVVGVHGVRDVVITALDPDLRTSPQKLALASKY